MPINMGLTLLSGAYLQNGRDDETGANKHAGLRHQCTQGSAVVQTSDLMGGKHSVCAMPRGQPLYLYQYLVPQASARKCTVLRQ